LTVETFQTEFEIDALVGVISLMRPQRILEVGAWHGGTLRHWMNLATDAVVVIDDEMRMADTWQRWADELGVELHLLHGHSEDPAIVERAQQFGPYDFCFIDGDHTYKTVRADWEHYGPPLTSIVALHDIIERPGYGVSQLWQEIRAQPGARWMEINETVEPHNETRHGIGVVWT
jgi:cephalosporin hydroxylase